MMYYKIIENKGHLYSLSIGFNRYKFTLFPMFYLTAHGIDFITIEVGWFTLIAKFEKANKLTNKDFKPIGDLFNTIL